MVDNLNEELDNNRRIIHISCLNESVSLASDDPTENMTFLSSLALELLYRVKNGIKPDKPED